MLSLFHLFAKEPAQTPPSEIEYLMISRKILKF